MLKVMITKANMTTHTLSKVLASDRNMIERQSEATINKLILISVRTVERIRRLFCEKAWPF